jgi:hypothetical protein
MPPETSTFTLSRAQRGQEAFVERPWPEAVKIVAAEPARVIRERGNSAICGRSYGSARADLRIAGLRSEKDEGKEPTVN